MKKTALTATSKPGKNSRVVGQVSNSISIPLKKFIVHFRRPNDYNGKYGFDWLRDDYIHPLQIVTHDTNGTVINAPTPLCKDHLLLPSAYGQDVVNPITPYNVDYYPAWLTIFPYTTNAQFTHGSTMHKDGINLDIEVEEIDDLSLDRSSTEIVFESGNSQYLKITPSKIKLSDFTAIYPKTKTLGSTIIVSYLKEKVINIKCVGGTLNNHTEIKVFAQLGTQKREIGKLMVYKNNIIPKAEIVVVNVITDNAPAQLKDDYQYMFKNQSFNQALIRTEVKVDTKFDISKLPLNSDVNIFKRNYINPQSQIRASQADNFLKDIITLYNNYGFHAPQGGINGNSNKRTYLFFTKISAGNTSGIADANLSATPIQWGNAYVVFGSALINGQTFIHECGHTLSLLHPFSNLSPYKFHHGYTDNYMDYTWKMGPRGTSSGDNIHKGKMYSFFKWQWDIMRNDRSLISNY
ncbi:hypothetical protein [Bacteroides sp. 224]|uniref:hypothetical protein n=1 Tax=Bacteroides sp. 224 TaxID=2302936 RepID=UPI0013D5A1E2|nr:hypothetical protein [Bacteroides sp. 224]NDV65233.1 hypothetical protein [Bacteroides sp. 224]